MVPPRAASTSTPPRIFLSLFNGASSIHSTSSSTKHLTTGRHAMIANCPRDALAVGHANGIVAPLWKLRGRARSQFAACQLYLRIGSVDGTGARDRETCSSSRRSSASQSRVRGSFRNGKGKINDTLTIRCLFDSLVMCVIVPSGWFAVSFFYPASRRINPPNVSD